MYIINAMITCLIFYPIALFYTIYKRRALEITFFLVILVFGAGISHLAFREYNSTASVIDCIFLGYSISWIPFAIMYGVAKISFEDSEVEVENNSTAEPVIIINGTKLNDAQAMTLRCACSHFGSDLLENGLGKDETGNAMTTNYLARLREIDQLLHLHCES